MQGMPYCFGTFRHTLNIFVGLRDERWKILGFINNCPTDPLHAFKMKNGDRWVDIRENNLLCMSLMLETVGDVNSGARWEH